MDDIFIGLAENGERQTLQLGKANRHGLIAGATGTGKTVTLQTLAEQFSAQGMPAFVAGPRATPTMWERAGKAAFGAAAASAGSILARKMSGRKTSASVGASAAGAAAGAIGTALGGAMLGRFARGLLGGLLR